MQWHVPCIRADMRRPSQRLQDGSHEQTTVFLLRCDCLDGCIHNRSKRTARVSFYCAQRFFDEEKKKEESNANMFHSICLPMIFQYAIYF